VKRDAGTPEYAALQRFIHLTRPPHARPGDRVVTVEDTFELDLTAPDIEAMQCRGASLDGTGEVTLRRLTKEALRMRPDRLVVEEVRESELLDLLIVLNSCVLRNLNGSQAGISALIKMS
jgi:pilus assembly protein CpaF